MKKIIFIIFILIVVTTKSFGQKIKDEMLGYNYTQLPLIKLANNIKTYSVKVITKVSEGTQIDETRYFVKVGKLDAVSRGSGTPPNLVYVDMEKSYADEFIDISGLQKVDEAGDIEITIIFPYLKVLERVELGLTQTEFAKVSRFSYKFKMPAKYQIKFRDSKIISEDVIFTEDQEFSDVTETRGMAPASINEYILNIASPLIQDVYEKVGEIASNMLSKDEIKLSFPLIL